jgi:phosphate starvation-inducible protein PhoH
MNYVELYTIMTRIGIDSKIIFCGDTKQNDINGKSGLDKFVKVLDNMPSACRIEFTIDDIVRSDLVKEFIIAESKI